jgi:uncharacterized protein (DUF2147 family)
MIATSFRNGIPTAFMKTTMKWPAFAVLVALALSLGQAGSASASGLPVGLWLLANQRIQMEVVPCDDRLCGKLVWFKNPNDPQGLPLVDAKNPDPALRTRPLLGLTVLRDLRPADDGTWEDGKIYNPDDGKEYQARMSVQDDGTLHVRAYVVLEMLGKTQIMTRVDHQQFAAVSQR